MPRAVDQLVHQSLPQAMAHRRQWLTHGILALQGIRPGEGAIREVAAYVLDHGNFAGVPPTAMVTCQPNMLPGSLGSSVHGAKVGSLQQFVPATTDCEEQGPSAFPVHEVHKIAQVIHPSATWAVRMQHHVSALRKR